MRFLRELQALPDGWYKGYGRWIFRPSFFLRGRRAGDITYNPMCDRIGPAILRRADGLVMARPIEPLREFVVHRGAASAVWCMTADGPQEAASLEDLRAASMVSLHRRQVKRSRDIVVRLSATLQLEKAEEP